MFSVKHLLTNIENELFLDLDQGKRALVGRLILSVQA